MGVILYVFIEERVRDILGKFSSSEWPRTDKSTNVATDCELTGDYSCVMNNISVDGSSVSTSELRSRYILKFSYVNILGYCVMFSDE